MRKQTHYDYRAHVGGLHKRSHRIAATIFENAKTNPRSPEVCGFLDGEWRSQRPHPAVTMVAHPKERPSRQPTSPAKKCERGGSQNRENKPISGFVNEIR
jgi:hypothetical protein